MPYASFERFELRLTARDVRMAYHTGRCDNDVPVVVARPYVRKQLDAIPADAIRAELRGYGAWDEIELRDDAQNRVRLVWLAAGDIVDNTGGIIAARIPR